MLQNRTIWDIFCSTMTGFGGMMRKFRLNNWMLRAAACFVDYESAQLTADSRIVEYGYVYGQLLGNNPKRSLDVGCVALHNYISPSLAMNGCETHGIDIRSEWSFKHPNFRFHQGDIRDVGFADSYFDTVFCISTLEHIGLSGYYGNRVYDKDGDLKAVKNIHRILKRNGVFYLTVPYKDTFLQRPGARVYDLNTLNALLKGFEVTDSVIYALKNGNWLRVPNTETEGVVCLTAVKL